MKLRRAIQPITQLKTHTAELLREVSTQGRPMVITQNGKAKVVMMDVDSYDRWRDALALLKILAHAQADIDSNRLLTEEQTFSRAEATLARSQRTRARSR